MAPKKTIKLPPRPAPAAPRAAQKEPAKKITDIHDLKVVNYVITFEDGSSLRAQGELADVIHKYLNTCEKICAEQQLVTYLGPSFARHDAQGNKIAQGSPIADIRR